jgi:hypothetical protein
MRRRSRIPELLIIDIYPGQGDSLFRKKGIALFVY